VTLVDGHAALEDQKAFASMMRERLGIEMTLLPSMARPAPDPLAVTLAHAALIASPRSAGLLAELVASSLPLLSPLESTPVLALRAVQALHAELAAGRAENAQLLEQLHATQEQLEPYLLKPRRPTDDGAQAFKAQRLEAEVASLRHQLEGKCRQVDAILASGSWRVTAPLRKLLDVVGG
jgi:hypothetical protein